MRMKTKNLFCAAVLLAYLFVGCSDGSDDNIGAPVVPEPETPAEPEIFRTAFECKTFAEALDTDFDEFKTAYGKFVLPENRTEQAAGRLSLGGYLKTPTDSVLLRITVSENADAKVEAIEAAAEDASLGRSLWEYFLTDSETLGLGSFLGTKYKGKTEGGVFQTIEETLQYVAANGMDDLRMCTLFGVVPGKAYAVPTIDRNGVKVELMKNYLPIDHSGLRGWIGGSYDDFADRHYVIGNKISLWGDNYVYIDYALDKAGNIFSAEFHTDADLQSVTHIVLNLAYEKYDAQTQLNIWKQYVKGDVDFALGTFKEAYKSDGFGGKGEAFESQDALIAHVEKNGRPGAFDGSYVVEFEQDGIITTLTLKSLYTQLVIKRAAD